MSTTSKNFFAEKGLQREKTFVRLGLSGDVRVGKNEKDFVLGLCLVGEYGKQIVQ
jgi:hypothetical protein